MEWHYFTVVDEYAGLDRCFRWCERPCDYCGVDCRFAMFDLDRGRWVPFMGFIDVDDGIAYCDGIDFQELGRVFNGGPWCYDD